MTQMEILPLIEGEFPDILLNFGYIVTRYMVFRINFWFFLVILMFEDSVSQITNPSIQTYLSINRAHGFRDERTYLYLRIQVERVFKDDRNTEHGILLNLLTCLILSVTTRRRLLLWRLRSSRRTTGGSSNWTVLP